MNNNDYLPANGAELVFNDGLAAVRFSNGTCNYVREDGSMLLPKGEPPTSDTRKVIREREFNPTNLGIIVYEQALITNAGPFKDGRAHVQIMGGDDYLVIDTKGKVVDYVLRQPSHCYVGNFSEGFADALLKNGRNGYINHNGENVFGVDFQGLLLPFHKGFAIVATDENNSSWRYIDTNGKLLFDKAFLYASYYYEGLALVKESEEGSYFFINTDGERAFEGEFFGAYDFSHGLSVVKESKDGNWFYINTKGERAFVGEYYQVNHFVEGMAAVKAKRNDNWIYINTKGEKAFDGDFLEAGRFSHSLAPVRFETGRYGYIKTNGKIAFDTDFAYINVDTHGVFNENGVAHVEMDNGLGATLRPDGRLCIWGTRGRIIKQLALLD